jgi:hypothetical protein
MDTATLVLDMKFEVMARVRSLDLGLDQIDVNSGQDLMATSSLSTKKKFLMNDQTGVISAIVVPLCRKRVPATTGLLRREEVEEVQVLTVSINLGKAMKQNMIC